MRSKYLLQQWYFLFPILTESRTLISRQTSAIGLREPVLEHEAEAHAKDALHEEVAKARLELVNFGGGFRARERHVLEAARGQVRKLTLVDFAKAHRERGEVEGLGGLVEDVFAEPAAALRKHFGAEVAPVWRRHRELRGGHRAKLLKLFLEELHDGVLDVHHDNVAVGHLHGAHSLEVVGVPLWKLLLPRLHQALVAGGLKHDTVGGERVARRQNARPVLALLVKNSARDTVHAHAEGEGKVVARARGEEHAVQMHAAEQRAGLLLLVLVLLREQDLAHRRLGHQKLARVLPVDLEELHRRGLFEVDAAREDRRRRRVGQARVLHAFARLVFDALCL